MGQVQHSSPQSCLLICHLLLPDILPTASSISGFGGRGNFIDHDFVIQCGGPLEPLATPLTAKALDGDFLVNVSPHSTHCSGYVWQSLRGDPVVPLRLLWSWSPLVVFRKDLVVSLLPHRLYNSAIDLLPGAPLPSSHLYNLPRLQRGHEEVYQGFRSCRYYLSILFTSRRQIFFFFLVEKKD